MDEGNEERVLASEVRAFVCRIMKSAGGDTEHAKALAEVLTLADARGHFSHGINRLNFYAGDIRDKIVKSHGTPSIINETAASAWVDGNNLLGPTVGKFCMELTIKKAKDVGIGIVVAKNSNHFGIAGWYSMMAKNEGLIGMSFTNTTARVVPSRSKKPHVGTSPISIAAPAGDDEAVLDMATSSVAIGKVEIASRKHVPVPSSWGCDSEGKVTTDPDTILNEGALFPLGGVEETGGYKGYGLSFMVDMLCGVLGGACCSYQVRRFIAPGGTGGDLGHCFIAINPAMFAPNFEQRLGTFIDSTRALETMEDNSPVLIPGDPERRNMSDSEKHGGIPYHRNVLAVLDDLAIEYKVDPIKRST